MPYIPDFDTEAVLHILNSIIQKHPEGSPERDAIELAQIALIYPRHIRKEDDFRRFYRDVYDPSFKLKVSHEFSTREEADEWLASGKAEDAERVRIAGKGFMVVRLPGRSTFMSAPLEGEEEETDESGEGSE
ncbi:hypothetical protein [Cystobacter fuscus]|uniref:hypothetical protein n=1 Tax=Cystobacter fuscus TaxID=43 RepID=UPI000BB364CA|nr:hypothetical protein [Cystobacter fuscus]